MRIQRQGKDTVCRRLSDRKISWTILFTPERRLQMERHGIVDSCLHTMLVKCLEDMISPRHLYNI
jgi:hypothetical protein